ncbi:hypothetical protein CEY16_02490 [Halalkalibacillus sediminis]|uniref:Uncharacterized protein n=1 Tax=Halalkalibacillus sediminis TaxID=2018042 RepID=A0A2I0QWF4_9BACI|nr:hypothetical protein [Halalkalibacillus sediminis]PKR78644.1 hypothetical protein CEY16_02490 [Halalkalibacillus sediminis]
MVGNFWWNILIASFFSVYVFILSILSMSPLFAILRALATFVIIYLIVYMFRMLAQFILTDKKNDTSSGIVDHSSSVSREKVDGNDEESSDDVSEEQARETAEAIRQMMNDSKQQER